MDDEVERRLSDVGSGKKKKFKDLFGSRTMTRSHFSFSILKLAAPLVTTMLDRYTWKLGPRSMWMLNRKV